jgi:alkaline phosphatase D
MPGLVELRTAVIRPQVSPDVRSVSLAYWKKGHPEKFWQKNDEDTPGKEFHPVQVEIGGLEINSRYQYGSQLNQVKKPAVGVFQTKDLWRWRTVCSDSRSGWEEIFQREYFRKTINAIA